MRFSFFALLLFLFPLFFFLSTRLTRIARCKRKTRLYNGFKFVLKLANMVASSGMGAIWNDNEVHIFGFLLFLFTPFFSFLVHGSLGSSYTKEKKNQAIFFILSEMTSLLLEKFMFLFERMTKKYIKLWILVVLKVGKILDESSPHCTYRNFFVGMEMAQVPLSGMDVISRYYKNCTLELEFRDEMKNQTQLSLEFWFLFFYSTSEFKPFYHGQLRGQFHNQFWEQP